MNNCLGLIGCKLGMTKLFKEDGCFVPVTVLDVSGNFVVQIKTLMKDGYSAVQVGFGKRRNVSRVTKPLVGHYAKAGVVPTYILREFVLSEAALTALALGQLLSASIFSVGQKVDACGISIGKGFAGVIKRHGFSSNRASHGNSASHRSAGSIGMCQDPGRVFPGKRMAGHLGVRRVSVQNVDVVRVDTECSLLWIKGAVPGCRGSNVIVRPAIKKARLRLAAGE